MDKRGNLHVLTHNQSPCYSGKAAPFFGADVRGCGAHFFSSDEVNANPATCTLTCQCTGVPPDTTLTCDLDPDTHGTAACHAGCTYSGRELEVCLARGLQRHGRVSYCALNFPPPPTTSIPPNAGGRFPHRYNDGTQMRYKRERPKVVQDPATGEIIALANGVGLEILDAFAPGNDSACSLVLTTPPPTAAR
jgi:hypothetical protein|eukprot:COSAG06_NODE_3636_length_5090_cov_2.096574_5_plen_192_part_00